MLKQPSMGERSGPTSASDFLALCAVVRKNLSEKRYRHVLGVARTAAKLAHQYGSSPRKARVAAMIHDIARNWQPERLLEFAHAHQIPVGEAELRAPVLLHARVAAQLAREQFGVTDPEMLAAIEHHTVAVPNMTDLEKILYIADSIEPSRTFSGRAALERAAHHSLDEGMLACLEASLEHLKNNDIAAPPATVALHRQLVERLEART